MTVEAAPAVPADAAALVSEQGVLAQLEVLMESTRKEIQEVEAEISEINGLIGAATNAPPHTDDIVAAFRRGLDDAEKTFKKQLGQHLNDANRRDGNAAAETARLRGHLLTVSGGAGGMTQGAVPRFPLVPGRLNVSGEALSVAALTYLLRDKIAAEIPNLVKELCPGSDTGMKAEQRNAALRELEVKKASKQARLEELKGILAQARSTLYPPSN